jgi:hypothetical protein
MHLPSHGDPPLLTHFQVTRFSWKAKDRRMNVINELLQNIRFLKFYGWGKLILSPRYLISDCTICTENHWASRGQEARESELQWRVKENIVDTLISFIWFAILYLPPIRTHSPETGHGFPLPPHCRLFCAIL